MKIKICLLIIVCFFFLNTYQCSRNDNIKKLADSNALALADSIKFYNNSLGTKTATIKALQLEKEQLEKLVLKKDYDLATLVKEFNTVNTVTKYKTITQVDTIIIKYPDTLPCVFERSGFKTDKWYSFNYRSDQNGIEIDSFKTETETTVITGLKRKWFLGEDILTADITNSNPHIEVLQLNAAQVIVQQPWYKKWYIWFAAGLTGGFFIAK